MGTKTAAYENNEVLHAHDIRPSHGTGGRHRRQRWMRCVSTLRDFTGVEIERRPPP